MKYLVFATLIWGFSFSLIGHYLANQVDVYFAVLIRIILASILFLPFTKWSMFKSNNYFGIKLALLGAIQLGAMYIFFYRSFNFISVSEVVIFTVFTPIYVTLFSEIIEKKLTPIYWVSSILAILGSLIIRYDDLNDNFVNGFLLVQGANICFAFGQVGYKILVKKTRVKQDFKHTEIFGFFYIGALFVAIIGFIFLGNSNFPTTGIQWGVLLWLGLVASGIGYFLWNKGATLVSTGSLAAMNNALIPIGLIVNYLFWDNYFHINRVILGGLIIFIAVLLSNGRFKRIFYKMDKHRIK